MLYTPTHQPNEDLDMAEGYVEAAEGQEDLHHSHRMTSEMFIIPPKEFNPAAETGLVAMVVLDAEGKDDDDTQDASLTTTETLFSLEDAVPTDVPTILQKNHLSEAPTVEETVLAVMPTAQPDAAAISNIAQKTVLVVEDTIELAEVIVATLEGLNLKTAHETHGDRAVEKFWQLNPDVLLLDINLPDTTGWKIMDAIKERLDATQGEMPKVIIITALDDPANRLIGKLQGIYSYLIKPFTPEEVSTLVLSALGISPAQ